MSAIVWRLDADVIDKSINAFVKRLMSALNTVRHKNSEVFNTYLVRD